MANSVTIVVTEICCKNTSEVGHDEVYIKYVVDGGRAKRFPDKGYHSLKDGECWNNIDLRISYKDNVNIQLYDSDNGKDDSLGQYTYVVADAEKTENTPYTNTNGASYVVTTTPG